MTYATKHLTDYSLCIFYVFVWQVCDLQVIFSGAWGAFAQGQSCQEMCIFFSQFCVFNYASWQSSDSQAFTNINLNPKQTLK